MFLIHFQLEMKQHCARQAI